MAIPENFVNQLKESISLAEFAARYIRVIKRGGQHIALCPFHSEKTPSFNINDARGTYHCFGCSENGDIYSFIKKMERLDFVGSIEFLANHLGIPVPKTERPENNENKEILSCACEWFAGNLCTHEKAMKQLLSRGITMEEIKLYKIGYAPRIGLVDFFKGKNISVDKLVAAGLVIKGDNGAYDRFRERVMFPITNRSGNIIAFAGRTLLNDHNIAKYINSCESDSFIKSHEVYGSPIRSNAKSDLVITEGYLDVIAMNRYIPSIAPMGTAISEHQIRIAWGICDDPIICFDGDYAGINASIRAAERALPILSPGKTLRFCILSGKDDPHSMITSGKWPVLKDMLENALPLSEFLWEKSIGMVGAKTPEQKALLHQKFKGWIDCIKDPLVKQRYTDFYYENVKKKKPASVAKKVGIMDSAKTQQEILLEMLIKYPNIIDEAHENLVHINIPVESGLCQIKDGILEWAVSDKTVAICDFMVGKEIEIDKILQNSGMTRNNLTDEEAAREWFDFFNLYQSNVNKKSEMGILKEKMISEKSPVSWQRVRKLRKFYTDGESNVSE